MSPTNTQSIFSSFTTPQSTVSSPSPSSFFVSRFVHTVADILRTYLLTYLNCSPLASLGSPAADTTEPLSTTSSLDDIDPSSSLDVQNSRTPTFKDSFPSSSLFDTSVIAETTSPLRFTAVSSHELPGPTQTPLSSNGVSLPSSASILALTSTRVDAPLPTFTPLPVPTSTDHGKDEDPSLTPTPPTDQSPSASLRDGVEFIKVTDIPNPSTPMPTGGQSQVVTATTIGGPVDSSIPNGETTGTALISSATPVPSENGGHPVPNVASRIAGTGTPSSSVGNAPTTPTSLEPPSGTGIVPTDSTVGEIGTPIISAPATPTIATTGTTSVPSSVISEYVVPFLYLFTRLTGNTFSIGQFDFFNPHRPYPHDNGETSSFTTTIEVVFFSRTQISGLPTSIPITEKIQTVLPTVMPSHFSHSLNGSVTPLPI